MSTGEQRLGFIGIGRVAHGLARAWHQAGYAIHAVGNRTPSHAVSLADEIGAAVMDYHSLVAACDIVFLTVSDDAIAPVVDELQTVDWQAKGVIHTSGAMNLDVLQPLVEQGAYAASLHPAFPFANHAVEPSSLRGIVCAIEADNAMLRDELVNLVAALGAFPIMIPSGKKAVYHLALVLASNYTVVLAAVAESLLRDIGAAKDVAHAALQPLLQATVENIARDGIPAALTGPLVRGDVQTVKHHLDVIDDDIVRQVYTGLARLSFPMLAARGVDFTELDNLLQD